MLAVRPAPRLVAGELSPAELGSVSDWIRLNDAVLVDYWEYRISTDQFILQLRSLPSGRTQAESSVLGETGPSSHLQAVRLS
jgi:hypothetical protein